MDVERGDQPTYFPGLDMVRIGAAALVALYHLAYLSNIRGTPAQVLAPGSATSWLTPITSSGWIGVEIFFVLSGFVIAQSATRTTALDFLKRRVLRLYPSAWICASLTVSTLLLAGTGDWLGLRYLFSLLLAPIPLWVDSSYWTLPVEIAFYILVAAGLKRHRVSATVMLVGAISCAFWLVWLFEGAFIEALMIRSAAKVLLLPHGCLFALGAVLAMKRYLWAVPFFAACLAEIVARSPGSATAPILMWVCAVVIIGCSVLSPPTRRGGALRVVAAATYPFYLMHQVTGAIIIGALMALGLQPLAALAAGLSTVMVMSVIVALRLEPQLRQALMRILGRTSPMTSAGRVLRRQSLL